ncbi:eukaryotic translation initiation factor 4 gamma 3-like isoform X2 [Argiope bruennichi]|uniref:eukaryotic translation initiation factor 4 gamma 3-like isoform X2 n=1 Tax=Argiope bruennichi TaxID=94029 RepID=UPI00249549D5|nr:eukaryotic translation initiation factor 4 gamma 3-like isoform X2 [Argiope bruennichi]
MNQNNSKKRHAKHGQGNHQDYYAPSRVPAPSTQSNTNTPIGAVVSQPNQLPSSQYRTIPTMAYPMHHNFNAFPPTLGNHQFLQMENTESNICAQPAKQVANSNDSHRDIRSKQHELLKTDTLCSPKKEEVGMQEMLIGRKKKARRRNNKNKQSESEKPATAYLVLPLPPSTEVPTIAPTPDSKRNLSSVPVMDSGILNTIPVLEEALTTLQNDVPTSKPTFETSFASPSADGKDKKNVVKPQHDKTVLKYSYKKDQWSPLNPEGKRQYDRDFLLQLATHPLSSCKLNDIPNVIKYKAYKVYIQNPPTKKKKKPAAPAMSSCGELFVPKYAPTALITEEPTTAYSVLPHPPTATAASTSAPTTNFKRNLSSSPAMDREILNTIPLFEETLITTLQNDVPASKPAFRTSSVSPRTDIKGKENAIEPQQNKVVLKYSYKEDQWSPLNPEGKKQYDREFLLQVSSDPLSLCKLNDIPNVIKYEPYKAYLQNPPTKKKKKRATPVVTKSGQFSCGELFVPKHAPTALFTGERQHVWKPLHMIEELLNEKDKLKRSVLGVLNKLTPQKFETLLAQLKSIPIDTEEKLAVVSNLIFENAINERKFSAVYAKLCNHLALIKVPTSGKSGTQVNFRKLLLTKCEKEFEFYRSDEKNEEKTKNLEAVDPHKRKELQIEYEEKERKIRNRQLGNIKFIGELFKLKMFIEPIMHGYIKKLLNQADDLSFECLSELLKTIGKELDGKGTIKMSCSKQMDIYLAQIKLIVDKQMASPRVRFMLEDVIDLKKNNWVPKKEENNPKTLDEICKEAEREACEQQHLLNNETNYPKTIPQDRDQPNNAELGVHSSEYNEDELEKSNSFRDGFRHNNDFEEVIRCVIEMASPNTVHMYINATINDFLERSSEARYSLGQLLASLLKKKKITFDQYKKGFAGVLEIIDDYALNIPLIWDYMGEILEPMIEVYETPFKLLKEVLEPCIPSEKAGMLLSSILHCAAKWKGTMKLGEVWRESGVQWTDIIGIDRNAAEFIEEHQLEFTMNPMKVIPPIQIPMEGMKKHLLSGLEKNDELEDVSNWIGANVSDTSDPTFVHALVTAVHESCLSDSGTAWKLNTSKLKSRIPLISCYVSTNKKLQLQSLYAAQALVDQLGQPSGLLHQIFYIMFDYGVVSEETFKEWKQSDDANEAEGKAVAIHSVKDFFTSLLESDKETKTQKLGGGNETPPSVLSNSMLNFAAYNSGFSLAELISRMSLNSINHDKQEVEEEKSGESSSFSSSLNTNVKLHKSPNPWKPLRLSEIPLDEKDKLKRNVLSILNKLTRQKFETLLSQLKGLNIDTIEKLALVIDLIFEKAIDEPNFSVPYANLCKHLALIKVPFSGTSGAQVNFRKLMLTKCQKEFEQDRKDELKTEEKMKSLEAADPDKRKELQLEYEEEEEEIRYRQLGNIRFVGELFKLGMLIGPVMRECIKKLLSQGDEESLECLSILLKTVGKELEDEKITKNPKDTQMDMYFAHIKLIIDKRLTSPRVRFKLQDVIDLKKNNWVPRRDANNPKTIDQIHKEAERESREQQQVYQNMTNYPKRIADYRDRRKNAGRMGPSEDGWTSSSKSNKGIYSVVDPSKLKLTKPDEVESIRSGPGGRGLQSWGRGSSGGPKTTADSDKTALTNKFPALSEQSLSSNYEGRRDSQRSAASSRESSRGRDSQLSPAIRKTSEAIAPEVKAATDVRGNGKAIAAEELTLKCPEYNEDFIEMKTKHIIGEFLHNKDVEETIKCVVELVSPNTVYIFINTTIIEVLEGSSQARYYVGQLLSSLLKKKIITSDQYKEGFAAILELINDYAKNIPLIWDRIGEILAPIMEDIETPFQLLKEVLQPCIPSEEAGMLVSSTMKCAVKWKLGKVWRESGMQWTDIIGMDGNVAEFVKKHQLEFTLSPTKANQQTQLPMEKMKTSLLNLLEKNSELEDVFDWVDANISDTSGPTFIRALVTAVHESCLSGSGATWELNISKLKSRTPLISRYVSTNRKLQLQAFYAVQDFMNQLD